MSSNVFSWISSSSASPSALRVRRTRRSTFFGRAAKDFPDIHRLFVRQRAIWIDHSTFRRYSPSMSDDRLSGLCLISGSAGMIITMSLHPTGHVPAAQTEPMIRMLIGVHALAIACIPVLFVGTLGLTRRLRSGHRLAISGLVVYTFALIAVLNAAVADGLITPSILRQIVDSAGAQPVADTWRMISHYNFY